MSSSFAVATAAAMLLGGVPVAGAGAGPGALRVLSEGFTQLLPIATLARRLADA